MMDKINRALLTLILIAIPLVSSAKTLMYVPSGAANDIVIIDLSTDEVSGRIDELENAHGLSGSPGSEYLVAGSMTRTAPAEQGQAVKPAAISEAEHQEHHAGDAAQSEEDAVSSFLSIVHPVHGHVVRRISVRAITHHTAISPDGKTAIAVHSTAAGISIIDLEKFAVSKTVQTGEFPNYAVFSQDGKHLYISNAQSATVSEIDTDDWTVVRNISVGKEPEHMAIATDGSKLFVVDVGGGAAAVVDLSQGAVTQTYQTGANPHGIDVSEDGRWLFVSSMGDGKLNRIDLISNDMVSINLQPAPYHLEYVDKVKKLYVSSRKESIIWVLNPETLLLVNTIDIKKGVAHQMVIRDE